MKRKRLEDDILFNGAIAGIKVLTSVGAAAVIGVACAGVPVGMLPGIIQLAVPVGIGGLAGAAGNVAGNHMQQVGKKVLRVTDIVSDALDAKFGDNEEEKVAEA